VGDPDFRLRPLLDAAEFPAESPDEYVARVGPLLPNMPADVLQQWFYEHWIQFEADYGWLGFTSLTFELAELATDQVPEADFGHEELLVSRTGFFERKSPFTPRMERVWRYMSEHGTWPRPVIVLENSRGSVPFPFGGGHGRPYHLIEGHNRVSCFRAFRRQGRHLAARHHMWLVRSCW
jgi:hypothetical protein